MTHKMLLCIAITAATAAVSNALSNANATAGGATVKLNTGQAFPVVSFGLQVCVPRTNDGTAAA